MVDNNFVFPTGKEIGQCATCATRSGSVLELLKAARKKAKAEPLVETTAEEQPQQESRIRKWIIDSKSIGRVELVYNEGKPKQAVVGGVKYRADEVKTLLGKRMRRKDLLAVHEIK